MSDESFFRLVEIPQHDPELCWEWKGLTDRDGYGRRYMKDRRTKGAHRVAYELLVGPIPDGLTLDHLCRNRACVNPSHLEPVSLLENYLRGVRARTHCRNGHEYTPENTAIRGNRKRTCRICERAVHRNYHHRRKQRGAA